MHERNVNDADRARQFSHGNENGVIIYNIVVCAAQSIRRCGLRIRQVRVVSVAYWRTRETFIVIDSRSAVNQLLPVSGRCHVGANLH